MTPEEKQKHNEQLIRCAAEWQNLLKLNEWNIAVGIGDKDVMKGQQASIFVKRETGQAMITILDKDQVDLYPFGFLEEEALVRKLLELRYEMVPASGETGVYLTRAHKIIADLLVRLKQSADMYHNVIAELSGTREEKPKAPEPKPAKKTGPRVIN